MLFYEYCIVKNCATKGSLSNTHTETHNTPYLHSSVYIVCAMGELTQALSLHFLSFQRDRPKHMKTSLQSDFFTALSLDLIHFKNVSAVIF